MKRHSWIAFVLFAALGSACSQDAKKAEQGKEEASDDAEGKKKPTKKPTKGSTGNDGGDEGSPAAESCPDFQQQLTAQLNEKLQAPVIGSVSVGGTLGATISKKGQTLKLSFDTKGVTIKPAIAKAQANKILQKKLSERTLDLVSPAEVDDPEMSKVGCAVLLAKKAISASGAANGAQGTTFAPAAPVLVPPTADESELQSVLGSGKKFDGLTASGAKGSNDGSVDIAVDGNTYAFDFQFGEADLAVLPDFDFELGGAGKFQTIKAEIPLPNGQQPIVIEFH